jgi:hypothetical protein
MKTLLALALAIAVSGCASTGPVNNCDGFRPIRPSREDIDVISDRLAEDILEHNEYYAKTCGN